MEFSDIPDHIFKEYPKCTYHKIDKCLLVTSYLLIISATIGITYLVKKSFV